MMKAIVIIAVILLLLVLFSLLPIKLYVKYENEAAVVKAGLLFFRFQIFPQKEKKPKKRKRKKKPTKAAVAAKEKQALFGIIRMRKRRRKAFKQPDDDGSQKNQRKSAGDKIPRFMLHHTQRTAKRGSTQRREIHQKRRSGLGGRQHAAGKQHQ